MKWYYYCYCIILSRLAVVCSVYIQYYHRYFVGTYTHVLKRSSINSGPDTTSFSLSIYLLLRPDLHSFVVIHLLFIFQAIRSPYLWSPIVFKEARGILLAQKPAFPPLHPTICCTIYYLAIQCLKMYPPILITNPAQHQFCYFVSWILVSFTNNVLCFSQSFWFRFRSRSHIFN